MSTVESIIIVPARMESKRLPGKPMLMAAGKPLVRWTWERAKQTRASNVIVATPNREIADYCNQSGMVWWPTSSEAPTGTHRCAEVLAKLKPEAKPKVVVNWQCDEPLADPSEVDRIINNALIQRVVDWVYTLVTRPVRNPENEKLDPRYNSSNVTKAAMSEHLTKVYWFSKAPMRGSGLHCGIYAFSADLLDKLGKLIPTRNSWAEGLEQLTWIEHGFTICPHVVRSFPGAINTERDWAEFKRRVESAD